MICVEEKDTSFKWTPEKGNFTSVIDGRRHFVRKVEMAPENRHFTSVLTVRRPLRRPGPRLRKKERRVGKKRVAEM